MRLYVLFTDRLVRNTPNLISNQHSSFVVYTSYLPLAEYRALGSGIGKLVVFQTGNIVSCHWLEQGGRIMCITYDANTMLSYQKKQFFLVLTIILTG